MKAIIGPGEPLGGIRVSWSLSQSLANIISNHKSRNSGVHVASALPTVLFCPSTDKGGGGCWEGGHQREDAADSKIWGFLFH